MDQGQNILLINPWIYDFTAYDFWLKPLGLLYIGGIIRKHTSSKISFIDCLDRFHPLLPKRIMSKEDGRGPFFKEEVKKPELYKDIPRKYSRYGIPVSLFLHELENVPKPDAVLLTCTMTYWYPGVKKVVELVRKKWGEVPIVLGGNYATLLSQHALSNAGVDAVIKGPGERRILSLLKEILGDKFFKEAEFETLDSLPQPAFDLLRDQYYLPVLTSRGCPFSCSYCGSKLLFKGFEQREPRLVAEEIEYYVRNLETSHFAFYDDALLVNKRSHIIPILKRLIDKNIRVSFHTPNGLHPEEIDLELALLFREAGFKSLFLSQESYDQTVLAESSGKVEAGSLAKALTNLEKAGYNRGEVNVYLLVGLPEQEAEGVRESILEVKRLGARPRLAYFAPVPGTAMWQRMVEKDYIADKADPLLHNKIAFPYFFGKISPRDIESFKELSRT